MILPGRTTATSKYLIDAKPGTAYSKVYENNVDNESFIYEFSKRMHSLFETPFTAIFAYDNEILVSKEYYDCKVKQVLSIKKGDISIALQKNSPYRIFLNHMLRKMFESGQMSKITEHWATPEQNCDPLIRTGNPLTLEKLISLFMIIGFGVLSAFMVWIYEKFFCKTKKIKNVTKSTTLEEAELLRFELIVDEVKSMLTKKTRPSPGILSLLQDASEKLKTE